MGNRRFSLSESDIEDIVSIAAEKGVEAYRKEHKKEEKARQSKALNNAKMIVTNYRRFKAMIENCVYDKNTTNDDELREVIKMMQGKFRDSEFEILSIKERMARTKLIMDHVDTMLEAYRIQCEISPNDEDARRYRIIRMLYLDSEPYTVEEVAEEEDVAERTVYRDVKEAFKRLSILFFGIDGASFFRNEEE